MAIHVIPAPADLRIHEGYLRLEAPIEIQFSDCFSREASFLYDCLIAKGFQTTVADTMPHDNATIVRLERDVDAALGDEGYVITVDEQSISIRSGTPAGIFYGIQTFKQLLGLGKDVCGERTIPCMEIVDTPRFSWRGYMLDESRHFFGKEYVKKILDWMALLKMNRFHWHLTDVPAWRIEIRGYPKLTTVGATGSCSDPTTPAQFYTQDDVREIVTYAEERHIVIIPEIDMPGHAAAANRAYPEFSGGGSERHPEFTFNPGKKETYAYLETILREVAELFPGPWLHFGADEVHFGNENWNHDPDVQSLMECYGLADLKSVERHFIDRIARFVQSLGKTPTGWDEVVSTGISSQTTVIWWRHNMPELRADSYAKEHPTILCPRIPCYFDFVQHDTHEWGRRWPKDGFGSIEQLYHYPPSDHLPEVDTLLLGVQGNLWTEMVATCERADFMTFPRLFALAEAGWTPADKKDWQRFNRSVKGLLPVLQDQGIRYFNYLDPAQSPEVAGVAKATAEALLKAENQGRSL